jgi:hypothetical protein
MWTRRPLTALALSWTLAAGSACGPKAPTDAEVATRAQAAIAPFKKSLKGALMAELAKSPVTAIEVCAEKAPALAKEASKDGVRVGRSSAKLRNQSNAPPDWLVPVMEELSKAPSGSAASRVVDLGGGKRGYAEAIWLDVPCLLCHGAAIAPDVEAKIAERYPQDAARGFQAGDFRGVFWVELDPPAK